jgi:hypothetical protein
MCSLAATPTCSLMKENNKKEEEIWRIGRGGNEEKLM